VRVFYWIDRGLGYALSGEISKEDLLRTATAVYQQLNP
jgi:anti-sigma factor RsiW